MHLSEGAIDFAVNQLTVKLLMLRPNFKPAQTQIAAVVFDDEW